MAKITVKHTRKLVVDQAKVAKLLGPLLVGEILNAVHEGVDVDGKPFEPYSPAWKAQLAAMGEGLEVDLRLTGGLLNSIKVLRVEERDGKTVLVIGPDTGTSPEVRPPAGAAGKIARAEKRRAKKLETASGLGHSIRAAAERDINARADRAIGRAQSAQRTGERGPPHNVLAMWINDGTAKMPARTFLGRDGKLMLRPEAHARIARALAKADIFKTVSG
jgi:hypothetical protein